MASHPSVMSSALLSLVFSANLLRVHSTSLSMLLTKILNIMDPDKLEKWAEKNLMKFNREGITPATSLDWGWKVAWQRRTWVS